MLRACREGDPEVLAIASRVIGCVVRTRGYYIPRDQRPDIVQEAMTDLVRTTRASSVATDEGFIALVRMVAHRRCVDWLREERRSARVEAGARLLALPDDGLAGAERRRLATEVFATLREPCRHLLALRVSRGLTYPQIAELLGRSEGALRNQCYHCLRQARDILKRLRRRQSFVRLVDWRRE
jgi:RNA polymerase sigma factor (sigma-70 family)